jgi:hypothetical protein
VPVSRRTRFAVEAQNVRETEDAGRDSYSRTRRRCSIRVPLVCSTTQRRALGLGTAPKDTEGLRAKLKRLVARQILIEAEPGLFALAPPTTLSTQDYEQDRQEVASPAAVA